MKNIQLHFRNSLIVISLVSISALAVSAESAKPFDYNNASTNFVNSTSSANNVNNSSSVNYANNTSAPRVDLFGKAYYLGGTIGQSEASSFCDGASGCEDSDTAWKLFGGYKLLENVSIEGAYLNLGDIRKSGENSDISAFAGYGVATLPVTKKFDAFAKLGGAYWKSENTDGKETGFGLAYGLGAKMTLNQTTKLRAEWEKVNGIETSRSDDADVSMLSIGIEITTF